MPAKDKFHQVVRTALEKEEWTITDDPLYIRFLNQEMWIDLAAERVIAAERQGVLYLAVPLDTYDTFFTMPYGQFVIENFS